MSFQTEFLKIKRAAGFLCKPFLERLHSGYKRCCTRYTRYYKYSKINQNTVLYEAFFGRGMLCNPYAIFRELIENPNYAHLKHIWVLDDPKNHAPLLAEYAGHRNVKFVKYRSRRYLKALCNAKYLINNVTFPAFFIKREGQVYVNTWHGIPLKKLGFDMPNGKIDSANIIRNFMHADYLISANSFLTGIYLDSYKLSGLYPGKIIEEGYPRLDLLSCADRQAVIRKLKSLSVTIEENKKIVLYAPTWRGDSYGSPFDTVDDYLQLKEFLEDRLDMQQYQILIKIHQVLYQKQKDRLDKIGFMIPATVDANEMLAITDILISDYSSIYFDFLATGRPILFYIPDLESYQESRGLYFTAKDLPGPCTKDMQDLPNWIRQIDHVAKDYRTVYEKSRLWCCGFPIGGISQRICKIIFEGDVAGCKIVTAPQTKKRILFSKGKMQINGISSSLINLLREIDTRQFDLSVLVEKSKIAEQTQHINDIPDDTRVFTRIGGINLTVFEDIRHRFFSYCGFRNSFFCFLYPQKAYQREIHRCFGTATFDFIIDFEGYNFYYSILLLQFKSARKSIWQHNDMKAEMRIKYPWLKTLFTCYPYFDKIISCSKEAMEVNRQNIAVPETYDKFAYAKNAIGIERILTGLKEEAVLQYLDGKTYEVINSSTQSGKVSVELAPLSPPDFPGEASPKEKAVVRFITVGRLSTEKNHLALIKAFSLLYQEQKNIMLYIVGDGPMKKETVNTVKNLHLEHHVILTGNLSNPFPLMKQCHCFILPSLHEGQPMVIHEARVLHMPIILSNFSSVKGALLDNGQLLIGTGVQDIYEGMKAFLEGKVPINYHFDPEAYNREAYAEFLRAIAFQ